MASGLHGPGGPQLTLCFPQSRARVTESMGLSRPGSTCTSPAPGGASARSPHRGPLWLAGPVPREETFLQGPAVSAASKVLHSRGQDRPPPECPQSLDCKGPAIRGRGQEERDGGMVKTSSCRALLRAEGARAAPCGPQGGNPWGGAQVLVILGSGTSVSPIPWLDTARPLHPSSTWPLSHWTQLQPPGWGTLSPHSKVNLSTSVTAQTLMHS